MSDFLQISSTFIEQAAAGVYVDKVALAASSNPCKRGQGFQFLCPIIIILYFVAVKNKHFVTSLAPMAREIL